MKEKIISCLLSFKPLRVKVYWNSHKKLFSVLYKGKVHFRTLSIVLKDVEFKINKNGREKVLKTNVKNVHGFVCGNLSSNCLLHTNKEFIYNPYLYNHFVDKNTKKSLLKAKEVFLTSRNNSPICFYAE